MSQCLLALSVEPVEVEVVAAGGVGAKATRQAVEVIMVVVTVDVVTVVEARAAVEVAAGVATVVVKEAAMAVPIAKAPEADAKPAAGTTTKKTAYVVLKMSRTKARASKRSQGRFRGRELKWQHTPPQLPQCSRC